MKPGNWLEIVEAVHYMTQHTEKYLAVIIGKKDIFPPINHHAMSGKQSATILY